MFGAFLTGCARTILKSEVVRVKVPATLTIQEPLPSLNIKTNGELLEAFVEAYSATERANLKLKKIEEFSNNETPPEEKHQGASVRK